MCVEATVAHAVKQQTHLIASCAAELTSHMFRTANSAHSRTNVSSEEVTCEGHPSLARAQAAGSSQERTVIAATLMQDGSHTTCEAMVRRRESKHGKVPDRDATPAATTAATTCSRR